MSDPTTPDAPAPEAAEAAPPKPATADTSFEADADPRLAELSAEVGRLKDQLLRALAEQENIRRRSEREREDARKFAISGFAKEIVPVADTLARALGAATDKTDPLFEGVAATERQLVAAFERHGLKRVEPKGQKFDPHFHEAMFEAPGTGQPAGTIIEVLQAGWLLNDRLLRPALVGVAKGEPDAASEAPQRVDTTA